MTAGYDREQDRQRLLTAILNHVPFDGWSETALQAAGQETGIPAERVLNAFPGGAKDVLILWHEVADQEMIAAMASPKIAHLRTRERVAAAIRIRLEANMAHREAVRAGCTVLLLPQNAAIATRLLYNTVNAIWYAIGDKSTDYNFYTKRALLAGVYSATVMYWLNDKSPDCAATWNFLERRIADVMRVPQLVGQATSRLRELAGRLPTPTNLFRHGRAARGRRRPAH
ncbi:MAG TPA: COQ9 family protein [Dongiaceae bacterium]|nr:COQ9 family protein [Dongiaceae bacterium]